MPDSLHGHEPAIKPTTETKPRLGISPAPRLTNEATPMLAEKFILLMETLKGHASPDGSYPPVVSTSPHVPVELPAASNKSFRDRAVVEFA